MKRWIIIGTSLYCLLLAGCSGSQSVNDYQKIEERVTTEAVASESHDEEEEIIDDIIDESLTYYPDDSHFYEEGPQPYIIEGGEGGAEAGSVDLEILDAFATKDVSEGGEYFVNSSQMEFLRDSAETEDNSWLFVKVRLTNHTNDKLKMYIGHLEIYKRIADEYGSRYGFSDQRLEFVGIGELDYDKSKEWGKNFYLVTIDGGENLETTLLYNVPTDDLKEKLYMQCFSVIPLGFYNMKTERWEPNPNENLRFLRVNVE